MRRETCCFTGHRNLPAEHLPAIPSLLDDTVAELIGRGIVDFACGGARGFDTLAAQSVLRARAASPVSALPRSNAGLAVEGRGGLCGYSRPGRRGFLRRGPLPPRLYAGAQPPSGR